MVKYVLNDFSLYSEFELKPEIHLYNSVRAPTWHCYLSDQSGPEYTSDMNNSAGKPQIDLL